MQAIHVPDASKADGRSPAEGTFDAVISGALNATTEMVCRGFSTVGFRLVPPAGATLRFEGTFDDSLWTPITVRMLGADGYTQTGLVAEDYIGSVSALTKFRVKTIVAGTGYGRIVGRFSSQVSTLEGIENGNAPHAIGYTVLSKEIASTGSVHNFPVWVANAGHRPIVTDINLMVDASMVMTLSDGPVEDRGYILRLSPKVTGGDSKFFPISFSLPRVCTNGTVYYTQNAAGTVTGIVHGYEAES